jgi:hypothetical protein
VYVKPSDDEKRQLIDAFSLDPFDREAINDPDEVPRIEHKPDSILLIWKRPDNVSRHETIEFEVSSLGLALS